MAHATFRRWRARSVRRGAVALTVALAAAPLLAGCGSGGGNTVNVYYAPEENFQSVVDNCNRQANGRYTIVYNKLPRDADGQREQMVRRLAAGDDGLDVLGLDVTWVAEFAEAKWIDPWTGENAKKATEGVLAGPLATAKWKGKLYAATKNTNVQLLWYRDDLTRTPPKTWDELIASAKRLKAQGKPHNILFTGAQYEGLVVFYNSLVDSFGGHILSDDGTRVVMDAGAVKALRVLKELVTSGITDPSLTSSQEGEVQRAYEKGDAAYELIWPFVYPAMQKDNPELAKHFRWARYPAASADQESRSTIGGFDLAVSSYSRHKPWAYEAALCLRSKENQKFSAVKDGVPPTIESIYNDTTPIDPSKPAGADNPSMRTAYPMRQTILEALKDPAVRPFTPAYQSLSTVMSKVLSPPSDIDPESTAADLRTRLTDALDSKGVIP
ncbi:MAG: ABC transporter substrate-binding protein [Sciscionella sp.]